MIIQSGVSLFKSSHFFTILVKINQTKILTLPAGFVTLIMVLALELIEC